MLARVGRIGFGMVAVDLGKAIGQWAVHVDRDRPHLVDGEQFLEAEDHPLGSAQAESGDDDLALQPRGPGDDGMELLHQAIVGVELAVAVSAFRDKDVDVANRGRVGKQAGVAPAQVAGEDEPSAAAVFGIIELDDRRAEDVPGVEVGQVHSRHDLARFVVSDPVQPLDDPFHVQQVKQRLGRLDVRMTQVGVAHLLALDPGTVAKHDAGDVGRGGRRVNRAVVPLFDQKRKPADVVVMSVRDDHRVERTRVERELAVGAVRVDAIGIEQTAVKQQAIGTNLQKMGASGDLPGRAVERDSQPTPSRRADDHEIRYRVGSPGCLPSS